MKISSNTLIWYVYSPALISASFQHARQNPNGTFPMGNSTSIGNSTSNSSAPLTSPSSSCIFTKSVAVTYPFILKLNSSNSNSSISLIYDDHLSTSSFHVTDDSAAPPPNQGVFLLAPNGTMQGGLNNQVHNAGVCSLQSFGGDVQFPACEGIRDENYNGTALDAITQQWVTRQVCVGDRTEIILLPDLGADMNGMVNDTYFHSLAGPNPMVFHAKQDLYGEFSFIGGKEEPYLLIIQRVQTVDLNNPLILAPVESQF